MLHNKAFETLLQELTPVLTNADKHQVLAKESIPAKFHEANPDQIVIAYEKYIQSKGDEPKSSVQTKLQNLNYHTPYDLFHDLKLACGVEIVQHAVGSTLYREVDEFFTFATNILLREVEAIGLKLFQEKEREEDDSLKIFREDFEKISRNFFSSNGEFITYVNKYEEPIAPTYHSAYNTHIQPETRTVTQPLFSGLLGKSSLDTRNTVVPDPWSLSKAVSTNVSSSPANNIKSFNNSASRIPMPTQATAQILENFFHPNWYTIEAPKWLQYKQKTLKPALDSTLVKKNDSNELRIHEKRSNISSIAPAIDSRNAVLSQELRSFVWLTHVGSKKLKEISKSDGQGVTEEVGTDSTTKDSTLQTKKTETAKVPVSDDNDEGYAYSKTSQVKLENLAQYYPEAQSLLDQLKSEKDEITKSPKELQKVISANLLKLHKLRQERYLHSTTPGTPAVAEVLLYKKILRFMTILAKSKPADGAEFSLQLNKKIPVLLNDYQGMLPGPIPSKPFQGNKTGRLASIRGPYKKKSRFL